jgi:pescadillo protein
MAKIQRRGAYIHAFSLPQPPHVLTFSQAKRARPKTTLPVLRRCANCRFLFPTFVVYVSSRVRARSNLLHIVSLTERAGIYPREPRNKKKAAKNSNSTQATTFYYTRDIQYLLHEPLLSKFRDHKALAKKIGRALGRNEISDANRMEKTLTPKMTLDHVIKERYPTFVDALRDLDDCLSMLFLFANLPSTDTVPPKTIQLCQRLTHEFEHYLIRSNSLRKSFLSIKGIYYQATIQGQDILWLVPYKFVQRVTGDVDFRIMGTFVQFYTTLLGFVNYRLYTSLGLVYPPKFDAKADEQGAELSAFAIEGRTVLQNQVEQPALSTKHVSATAQAEADRLLSIPSGEEPPSSYATAQENPSSNSQDQEEQGSQQDGELDAFPAPLDLQADVLHQPTISASTAANLFEPFTIYLSRETPRHPLEFILRAFGCKRVAWDTVLGHGAYTSDESDRRITHQIVDRPNLPLPAVPVEDEETAAANAPMRLRPGERVPGRIYVQPQWVWDCINAGKLLRADLYASGATLPPHLSPWIKPKQGEYDPTKSLAEQENEGEALAAEAGESDEEMADEDVGSDGEEIDGVRGDDEARDMESNLLQSGKQVATGEGMDVELAESEDDDEDDEEAEKDEEFDGFSGDEDDDDDDSEDEAARHQRELAAEAGGRSLTADAGATPAKALRKKEAEKAQKAISRQRKEAQEETDRQKMMMSRRKRKMFEKMQYSNAKKDAEAEKLRGKRRKIEKVQAKN